MNSDKTTDLDVILKYPSRFTWGTVQKFHTVGPYTLVEYIEGRDSTSTLYHIYVEGKDTCTRAASLDRALITAIANKNLEANQARYMAMGAAKLFGI